MASNFARAMMRCNSSRAATLSRSTFLGGTGTSASMKRTRAQTRGQVSREEEEERACPVCFEVLCERTIVYAFECGHAICRGCDNGLWSRHLDNCPLCRAARCDDAAAHLPTRPARAATTPEYVTFPVSEVEILPLVGQFVAPDTDLDPTAQQRIAHHGGHEETPTRLAAVVAALQDPEIAAALRALQEPTTVTQFHRRVLSARRH